MYCILSFADVNHQFYGRKLILPSDASNLMFVTGSQLQKFEANLKENFDLVYAPLVSGPETVHLH